MSTTDDDRQLLESASLSLSAPIEHTSQSTTPPLEINNIVIDDNNNNNNSTCDLFTSTTPKTTTQDESVVLQTLARQLEYYFSPQNLSTDTYLQTLRDLNDGCVPVTILANFAKVRAILLAPTRAAAAAATTTTTTSTAVSSSLSSSPESPSSSSPNSSKKKQLATATTTTTARLVLLEEELRMHFILQAVNKDCSYTDLLQIYSIDTATGKIATDETPSSAITILAVGLLLSSSLTSSSDNNISSSTTMAPTTNPMLTTTSTNNNNDSNSSTTVIATTTTLATTTESNTIILRDVGPTVTDSEVYALLQEIEDCPTILSIVSDVANSWFILFEPSDRSNLMRVMMELRSMTFPSTGEYVMARLRASIVSLPTSSSWSTMTDLHTAEAHHQHHLLPKKKKKKRSKTKKKKKKASTVHPVDCTENTGCDNKMMPPALTEDHFPSLGIDSDSNVGWDTTASPVGERAEEEDDDDEDEDNSSQEENDAYSSEESVKQGCLCGAEDERKSTKVPSDGASTATTASSNASSSSSFELMSKKQQILSGYAAALLKDPSVPTRTHNKVVCTVPDAVHESFRVLPISRSLISDDDDNDDVQVKVAPDPVVITSPLTWGEGHTFADILRQK